jgi:DNA polymerase-4
MKTEVGDWLRCSIGVAENKLLAKIASDMQKPDGLTVVTNKKELYDKLSLIDIPGIGHRQEKRLKEMGINTLADLRDYPRSKLIARFGLMGHHLHEMGQLNSSWKPSVDQEDEIKSLGHMYTLPKEYREAKFFVPVLYKLSEMVARRMRVQHLTGNILHFHIHDLNHECYGQSKKLGYYLRDGREIFFEAVKIAEQSLMGTRTDRGKIQFKLIGVTVAGLMEESGQQSLFERDEKSKRVVNALDKINEKYGDFKVCRVPVQLAGNVFRDSIGFGRIKEHIKLASFL